MKIIKACLLAVVAVMALPLTSTAQAEGRMGGVSHTIIITNPIPDENSIKDGIQIIAPRYIKHNQGTNLQLQIIKDGKLDSSAYVRYITSISLDRQGYSTNIMVYFRGGVATVPVNCALPGKQDITFTVEQIGKQTITVNVE